MTDQTAPKPITAAAANAWSFAIELLKSPLTQTLASLLVAALLGAGGLAGYQKVTAATAPSPHLVLQAADAPKADPVVSTLTMGDINQALQLQCGDLGGKLDEVKKLLEPKGSLKKTSARGK